MPATELGNSNRYTAATLVYLNKDKLEIKHGALDAKCFPVSDIWRYRSTGKTKYSINHYCLLLCLYYRGIHIFFLFLLKTKIMGTR